MVLPRIQPCSPGGSGRSASWPRLCAGLGTCLRILSVPCWYGLSFTGNTLPCAGCEGVFVGEMGLSLSIWEGLQHPPVSEGPCRTLGAKSRGWWCYSAMNFLSIGPCALCITPRADVRSADSPLGLTGQTGSCVGACPCWLLLPASDSSKASLPLFVLGKMQSPLFPYKKPCYRGNGFVSLWQPRGGWIGGGAGVWGSAGFAPPALGCSVLSPVGPELCSLHWDNEGFQHVPCVCPPSQTTIFLQKTALSHVSHAEPSWGHHNAN